MSYLSAPRLIFAGQFQADPSTINNDPEHFDTKDFRSNYQLPGPGASNGWWNPSGTGAWRFRNCKVTRVIYRDGTMSDSSDLDPIVGMSVNDSNTRVEGKLVDLDPEQQMVSEVWGFQVRVGGSHGLGFGGNFRVAAFTDIWVRYPQGQPDSFFGAFYQSVLEGLQWGGGENVSRFLKELSANGGPPKLLSIKFNVDGYNDDSTTPEFTFGRVVGSIGLYQPGEPAHFVAGRRLYVANPPPSPLNVNTAYAQVVGDTLTVDLGNSMATQSPGGPLVDQGSLYLALQPSTGNPVVLGEIEYLRPRWYERTAGIASFKLSPDQLKQAASTPLTLLQSGDQGLQPLLAEPANGLWVRADDYVFRLDPGDTATTTFYVQSFGQPAANQTVSLNYDPSIMQGQTKQGPVSGPRIVGEPQKALTFATSLTTSAQGTAQLSLQAGDPGNPRKYIDGQMYGVTYGVGSTAPAVGSVQNPSDILNVLVFSGYKVPEQPTWMEDVRPIFQQYANLYPVMRPIVDLGNYASVVARKKLLRNVFSSPVTDPNYMPVTRDLSRAKREMLLKWLQRPEYMRLDSVEDLKQALQQAIELEHSTIPPYLCALYSIKPGSNVEVASLLRGIVVEEMLHMALSCNLLISIGGSPRMNHPGFVPIYPGSLPGGLRGNLIVRLRKASIAQFRDVFMSIEEPRLTREPVDGHVDPNDPIEVSRYTIGWFYTEIERALERLSNKGAITFGNVEKQVTGWTGPGRLFAINSLKDARRAIREIQRQGEGASPVSPKDGYHELAHFYKFSEVVEGRRIVIQGDGFSYTGEAIPFDPAGVWPMMDDPDLALLPKGSRARILTEQFARTYQALLNGLHRTFNGEPDYLKQALGLMYSLDLAAQQLMQTPSGLPDGSTAGPSFQLPTPE
jgi:hypothetical protein